MSSKQRLHPYSILFAFLTQIRLFIVPGVLLFFGIGRSNSEWWQPWMMAFVIPNAIFAVFRYFTYQYRFDASELVIDSGLLFKRERHIPYARIQNIDAVQNVLHRALNVAEVRIETGGGGTSEARMSVVPAGAIDEMRARVFADRRGGTTEAAPTDPPPLLQLGIRDLLLCGFIENRGAVLIAAAAGGLWELGVIERLLRPFVREQLVARGSLRGLFRGDWASFSLSWERVAVLLVGIPVLLVLIRVFSMAWAVVRLYGFRLAMVNDEVQSRFGLFTRVAMTIPLRRIQSLTVREGPWHRRFARVAVRVDTAGARHEPGEESNEREAIAPILERHALPALIDRLVGIDVSRPEWQAPHPRAFRRELIGWVMVTIPPAAAILYFFPWHALWVIPLLAAWAVIGARQTVKHLRWATAGDAVVFSAGWIWRRTSMVKIEKIQVVSVIHNPLDRRHGMATLHVDAAGASDGSAVRIPYMPRDVADALRLRLTAEAARMQLRW